MYYQHFYSESMVTVPGTPPNIKSSFHHPQVNFFHQRNLNVVEKKYLVSYLGDR